MNGKSAHETGFYSTDEARMLRKLLGRGATLCTWRVPAIMPGTGPAQPDSRLDILGDDEDSVIARLLHGALRSSDNFAVSHVTGATVSTLLGLVRTNIRISEMSLASLETFCSCRILLLSRVFRILIFR
jgi:hypothetical protein